jgi:AraC family transcriptional regulator of adaptative response/methylated-DNA-[protein]-cysteine methyltransferase
MATASTTHDRAAPGDSRGGDRRPAAAPRDPSAAGVPPSAGATGDLARRARDERSGRGPFSSAPSGSIRFAVGECSLGTILVAATDNGLCAILLGDEPEALVRDLRKRFPTARLVGGEGALEPLMARVIGLVETPAGGLDVPIDAQGTHFQQRVWQALREIPAGSTASYTDVARRIGAPRAGRAVAKACAANPLAVAIPCHRVVRTGGALSGYRWGVERKRVLLAREAGS